MNWEVLSNAPFFKGFTPESVESIFTSFHYQVRRYGEGDVVAISGEKVNSFRMVLAGMVKGEMTDNTGKVLKIENITPPGALAPAFLFGATNRFPVDVIAVETSDILVIDKGEFINMMSKYPAILENYLDMICSRSQFLSEKIRFFTFKTIRARIADYLLGVSASGSNTIRLEITQLEMSELFGVARPSVARALKELESAGILLADRKDILILNREALIEVAKD